MGKEEKAQKLTMPEIAKIIVRAPVNAAQAALMKKYGIAEKDCIYLMLMFAKAVKMAGDGDTGAMDFVNNTLRYHKLFKMYAENLEKLIADKEAARILFYENNET